MGNKRNGSSPPDELWEKAMGWVSSNKALVRQIAAPYRRHMAAEAADIEQEAVIAAFQALLETCRKEQPDQLAPFFRVIFRTNCMKLASGLQTMDCQEIDDLPAPERDERPEEDVDHADVKKALQGMTKRQRQVCCWLLQQPEPVSTPDIAREFKISRRHACRLISNSIARLAGEVAA
ncbi:MAG: hypothetical protein A2521_04955 [Deltaproteobacteria bacterium RIFOXYD12_FULL_57_12]|nr:MAG: hypothetical protein A2521_04955 [Deltaproteobacteria bacterium RIFOXYD12_FULL_57_12]